MKFRCEREILADALTTAGRAATNRSGTLPVLSGVRLDVADGRLTVTGTDLELTIRLSVPVHVDKEGSAVVPARLVGDIEPHPGQHGQRARPVRGCPPSSGQRISQDLSFAAELHSVALLPMR